MQRVQCQFEDEVKLHMMVFIAVWWHAECGDATFKVCGYAKYANARIADIGSRRTISRVKRRFELILVRI